VSINFKERNIREAPSSLKFSNCWAVPVLIGLSEAPERWAKHIWPSLAKRVVFSAFASRWAVYLALNQGEPLAPASTRRAVHTAPATRGEPFIRPSHLTKRAVHTVLATTGWAFDPCIHETSRPFGPRINEVRRLYGPRIRDPRSKSLATVASFVLKWRLLRHGTSTRNITHEDLDHRFI